MNFKRVVFPSLYDACKTRLKLRRFTPEALERASLIITAIKEGKQIPPFSEGRPDFDLSKAYDTSAAFCHKTQSNTGLVPVGRKIGFTNKTIWPQYNVTEPNWGYLYDKTTYDVRATQINISEVTASLQPRIEPEIIFGLKSAPHSSMTEKEALACVRWIAHGFEIVVSVFKDWQFTLADTTAVNALHSRLFIGKKRLLDKRDIDILPSELENFQVVMKETKGQHETGSGSNVLGSPIKALLHLCRMLESQSMHPPLCTGEIISTGTLTNAMPMADGDVWTTELSGIDLPGLVMPVTKVEGLSKSQWRERQERRGGIQRLALGDIAEDDDNTKRSEQTERHVKIEKNGKTEKDGKDEMSARSMNRIRRSEEWREFQEFRDFQKWKRMQKQKENQVPQGQKEPRQQKKQKEQKGISKPYETVEPKE